MIFLYKIKYRFLIAAFVLMFMGAISKIDHYEKASYSLIGGIFMMIIYASIRMYGDSRYTKESKNI